MSVYVCVCFTTVFALAFCSVGIITTYIKQRADELEILLHDVLRQLNPEEDE